MGFFFAVFCTSPYLIIVCTFLHTFGCGKFLFPVFTFPHVRPTKPLCRVYPLATESNARGVVKRDGGADRGNTKPRWLPSQLLRVRAARKVTWLAVSMNKKHHHNYHSKVIGWCYSLSSGMNCTTSFGVQSSITQIFSSVERVILRFFFRVSRVLLSSPLLRNWYYDIFLCCMVSQRGAKSIDSVTTLVFVLYFSLYGLGF